MKDVTVSTVNVTDTDFAIYPPGKSGTIVIDKDTDELYYSDSKAWHEILASDSLTNIGDGAEVLVEESENPVEFRTLLGTGMINIEQNEETVELSLIDESYSEDKSGTQLVNATEDFTFTVVKPWAQLGIGRYNTGSFDETEGVFTALNTGKYHFDATLRTSAMIETSTIFLRLFHITSGVQLAEVSLPGSLVTANGGLILQLSHECALTEDDQIALQACYLVPPGSLPVDPMQIVPFLGSSIFNGRKVL